ncbi:hypothetical protein HHI36_014907 [Cryptolaemus montrouzieri]|uniref:Uncharacterized protein n=1 Tax=Cryptolaemus montrouzieri TaxID=559131 RepID=A0ABD2N432_9CUCU
MDSDIEEVYVHEFFDVEEENENSFPEISNESLNKKENNSNITLPKPDQPEESIEVGESLEPRSLLRV